MSGNSPISYNNNYTKLFQVRSIDKCDNAQSIELYKNKLTNDYLLYRYVHNDNSYPLKIVHKFTSLIGYEMIESNGIISLLITTVYGNSNIVSHKFTACCGTKLHVLQVENEIIKHLL